MLLRLAYLGVMNAFAMLRLLPMSDRDKDAEILALRHQVTVLERQLGKERVRFTPSDRTFPAALLHRLPPDVLRRLRLLVRPDTVLRWRRGLLARRHATQSRPKRPGRPRTVHSVRVPITLLPNLGWARCGCHSVTWVTAPLGMRQSSHCSASFGDCPTVHGDHLFLRDYCHSEWQFIGLVTVMR